MNLTRIRRRKVSETDEKGTGEAHKVGSSGEVDLDRVGDEARRQGPHGINHGVVGEVLDGPALSDAIEEDFADDEGRRRRVLHSRSRSRARKLRTGTEGTHQQADEGHQPFQPSRLLRKGVRRHGVQVGGQAETVQADLRNEARETWACLVSRCERRF